MSYKNKIVVSVGGSLIHPKEGVSVNFLKGLNTFIRDEIKNNNEYQFLISHNYVFKSNINHNQFS